MSTPHYRDATAILSSQHDWTTWYNQIKALCATHLIWEYVKEEAPLPFIIKPILPTPPECSIYTPAAGYEEATRVSQLSTQGQKMYKEDLDAYKIDIEHYKLTIQEYNTQQKSVQHITQLIQSTVAPYLQRTCCLPDQSLRQWLANLKLTVGVDDRIEKERTRERYYAALKPMRNTHNWDTWLVEYDQASSDATVHGVSEVKDIDNITKDFLQAVNKAAPMWAAAFQNNGRFNPSMTRKEMMKRFREYMSLNHPLKPVYKKQAFFAEADDSSFLAEGGATTQDSQKDASAAMESAPSNPRGRTRGGQRQGYQAASQSGKRIAEKGTSSGKKCPACDQVHDIKECWYINSNQAPEWWKPNTQVTQLVGYKRKHDPVLQGALRGMSRTKSQTPAIKRSDSSTPNIQELSDDNQQ